MRSTMIQFLLVMRTSESCFEWKFWSHLIFILCRCLANRDWTPDSKTPRMKWLMSVSIAAEWLAHLVDTSH
jgi:hypothetical protein